MQSIAPSNWKHAFQEIEYNLKSKWNKAANKLKGLFEKSSDPSLVGESKPFALFRKNRNLEHFFWNGSQRIEISETEDEIVLRAKIPGLRKDEFSVEIEDRFLTFRCEHSETSKSKTRTYIRSEKSFSSFSRTIALPCEVDGSKSKAKYRKGKLTLTLPKTRKSQMRKIPIWS